MLKLSPVSFCPCFNRAREKRPRLREEARPRSASPKRSAVSVAHTVKKVSTTKKVIEIYFENKDVLSGKEAAVSKVSQGEMAETCTSIQVLRSRR